MSTQALLRVSSVSVSFGGLKALQDLSLQVKEGSITALIGPNGAGKTTLFSLVSGFVTPSSGTVHFRDRDLASLATYQRARLGIARTFQIVQPFAGQTVWDNITVGSFLHIANRRAAREHAFEIAESLGLQQLLERDAAALTIAQRKRLEVAKALATQPRLLLLDEVLAGLNPAEVQEMLPVLRRLPGRGITILMIEHVMQAVMNLAQDVYVIANGRLICHGSPQHVTSDPGVIEAYLGHGTAARLKLAHEGRP